MLNSNFHTHTTLCRHAVGDPREYVESAIKSGLKKLGFSDHSPYIFKGEYYSHFRMFLNDTENYVKTVLELKREYRKDITVYLGFEMEYYPRHFEQTFNFLNAFSPDYFILAQHCTNNEYDGVYVGNNDLTKRDLDDYVNQVIEAMKTGVFSYVAHPDIIALSGDENYYVEQMKRLCLTAKEFNIPLEFNFLGFVTNRRYPSKKFFNMVNDCGNTVIYGVDAHSPKALEICNQTKEKADNFLLEFNLIRTENIKLLNGTIV